MLFARFDGKGWLIFDKKSQVGYSNTRDTVYGSRWVDIPFVGRLDKRMLRKHGASPIL